MQVGICRLPPREKRLRSTTAVVRWCATRRAASIAGHGYSFLLSVTAANPYVCWPGVRVLASGPNSTRRRFADSLAAHASGSRLPSQAEARTYADVVSEYRWHPEAKSLAPDGSKCGARTAGASSTYASRSCPRICNYWKRDESEMGTRRRYQSTST
jgi:hypothetical protein